MRTDGSIGGFQGHTDPKSAPLLKKVALLKQEGVNFTTTGDVHVGSMLKFVSLPATPGCQLTAHNLKAFQAEMAVLAEKAGASSSTQAPQQTLAAAAMVDE